MAYMKVNSMKNTDFTYLRTKVWPEEVHGLASVSRGLF